MPVALTTTQSELENQKKQWQEERSHLLEYTLQEKEKTWEAKQVNMKERMNHLEEEIKNIDKKPEKKPLCGRESSDNLSELEDSWLLILQANRPIELPTYNSHYPISLPAIREEGISN